MKTAGIIAEYNPFHNGHQFHIEETRRRTGADYIIVVMSGDFVQRGAPAILDKYTRAEMALCHGADLVFELPVTAALSSAEGFAAGGVSLLNHLGVVDILSFGCESASADTALFQNIVKILADEPEEYRNHLAAQLKQGLPFPKARELAVIRYLQPQTEPRRGTLIAEEPVKPSSADSGYSDTTLIRKSQIPTVHQLLSEPNNILALEYAKALRKSGRPMELCMIPRTGASYHASELSDRYCSATAIRKFIFSDSISTVADNCSGKNVPCQNITAANRTETSRRRFQKLQNRMPTDAADTLCDAALKHQCLRENDFSDLLFYSLTEKKDRLADFGPANKDLSGRTANLLEQFTSWTDFAALLKSKNQTCTAISRYLTQILLNITRDDLQLSASFDFAPYARILGFKREAAPLLTAIYECADIPVLMHLAKDAPKLEEGRKQLLDVTLQSSEIYKRILFSHSGRRLKSEYRQPLLCRE
ncbi:MAG: nucleotidyltransferase family protein [Clostridiales bacterium]|nr:nucleotidyltransferase family protein [Clostridiales bacterium]